MFSLISGLIKYFFSKTEIRILILGLDYAGKTTLLERTKSAYRKNKNAVIIPPEKITPTIGLNVSTIEINRCMVLFWDVSGQIKMRTIWQHYYADANGLIFVVDSTDIDRLGEVKLALQAVLEHPHIRQIPLLVLVNKQDLPGALSAEDLHQTIFSFLDPDQVVEINDSSVRKNSQVEFNGIVSRKSFYPSLDELELVTNSKLLGSEQILKRNDVDHRDEHFSSAPRRNQTIDSEEDEVDPVSISSSATITYSNHRDRDQQEKSQRTSQISKRNTPNNRSRNKIKELNNSINNNKDSSHNDTESAKSSLPLKAKQSPSFPSLGFGEKVYKFDKSGALNLDSLSESQNNPKRNSFHDTSFPNDGYFRHSSALSKKKIRKIRLQECSAISGLGIEEGIQWIVQEGKVDARELLI